MIDVRSGRMVSERNAKAAPCTGNDVLVAMRTILELEVWLALSLCERVLTSGSVRVGEGGGASSCSRL